MIQISFYTFTSFISFSRSSQVIVSASIFNAPTRCIAVLILVLIAFSFKIFRIQLCDTPDSSDNFDTFMFCCSISSDFLSVKYIIHLKNTFLLLLIANNNYNCVNYKRKASFRVVYPDRTHDKPLVFACVFYNFLLSFIFTY